MPMPPTQTQPRTYSITLRSLLALPFRICNPPPAVGKVRSCGVTPLIDVRLEDILDRQHLPPLGLKDFEEWLLFVEMSPENLYFILWLREYKQRYAQWQSQTDFHLRTQPLPPSPPSPSPSHRTTRPPSPPPEPDDPAPSAHLAMFFARAKQTFFTPGSAYELNLPSALLAPLHRPAPTPASSTALHPHPAALRPVEREVYAALDASRARFVSAQLNNVGSRRVLCGILAGIAFCLIGAAAPLAALFARGGARWARLAALPGLWAGLTVLFASINGICMGVYIFGDLRQLRRFELARPRISRPRPLPPFAPIAQVADAAHSPSNTHAAHIANPTTNPTLGGAHPKRSPSAAGSLASLASTSASHSTASLASSASDGDGIRISPAYFDADAHADDARGGGGAGSDLYAPRPESALDWDADADGMRGYGIVGGVDFSALEDAESVRDEGRGSVQEEEEEEEGEYDGGGESAHVAGGGQTMPLAIPRVLGTGMGTGTRSVRSASTASGASEATVFTGTATFIHPFTLSSSPDADADADAPLTAGQALHERTGMGANEVDDDDAALARAIARPAKHQRVAPFDFDGLPVWGGGVRARARRSNPHSHSHDHNHHHHSHNHHHASPNYHTATYHNTAAYAHPHHTHPDAYNSNAYPSAYHDTFAHPNPSAYQDHFGASAYQDHFPAPSSSTPIPSSPIPIPRAAARPRGLRGALARMQERCGLERRRLQIGFLERPSSGPSPKVGVDAKGYKPRDADEGDAQSPHWSSAYWRGEMGVASSLGAGGLGGEGMDIGMGGRRSADSEKTHMDDADLHDSEAWARDAEGKGGVHGSGARHSGAHGKGGHGKGGNRKGGKGAKGSHNHTQGSSKKDKDKAQQQDWWRAVPAFAVPLARVLAPAVVRAHWEIVVRSAALAALVSVMVLVVVLAVPVTVPV